jgi:hypothetical protein
MGFNRRRKIEDQRRQAAEKEAAEHRATDAQVLEDAECLIAAWNERQAKRMPMLFSPTIGAAITVGYWFLWVRCPACRTTNAIDLRTLDRHRDAAVTSLIPALSCRSCRPNAPFAELVRLSRISIADEMRVEHTRRPKGDVRVTKLLLRNLIHEPHSTRCNPCCNRPILSSRRVFLSLGAGHDTALQTKG